MRGSRWTAASRDDTIRHTHVLTAVSGSQLPNASRVTTQLLERRVVHWQR